MTNLEGRAALITGASQGLGRAIAEQYVRAGASVLLTARAAGLLDSTRDQLAALARPGQRVLAKQADVSSPEDCRDLVAYAAGRLPDLCILVNNAGIQGPLGPMGGVRWEDWAATIGTNLLGTACMCHHIIPHLRERGCGKIINLSGGGATAARPFLSAYAASKAALVRLTETLAEELAGCRVDVNAIAPGAMNTRMLDEVLAAGPDRVGREAYESAQKQRDSGGAGMERASALAVFLASALSDGITGRLLSAIWDDWAGLPARREELAGSDVFKLRRINPEDRGRVWKCA